MLCNMPSFLNKSGLFERQFLARREVPSGGKLGGKLLPSCPALWDTFTVYLPSNTKEKYDYDRTRDSRDYANA